MVKINRPVYGFVGVFLFILSSFAIGYSLNCYLDFLQSNDIITFSSVAGFMIFSTPLLFYFSYLGLWGAVKNKLPIANNSLFAKLTMIGFFGMAFSFVFSSYLNYSLLSQGYIICPNKISWMSPNKYVRDISLCYKQ